MTTTLNTLKQTCNTINKLFSQPDFFKLLYSVSNNDIEEVINNISNIINYYLSTNDLIYTYSIQELINKSKQIPITNDIFIYPSNAYYERKYRLFGLNFPNIYLDSTTIELDLLSQQLSFQDHIQDSYSLVITKDVHEAIILSHISPQIVYKSILKQPHNQELPIVVGTPESYYYQSILEIRLNNLDDLSRKTSAKKAKKIISRYTNNDSLLVLFPNSTKHYNLSETNQTLFNHIPSHYLCFIKIPSRYKLLSICSENKQIRKGEIITFQRGDIYHKQVPTPGIKYHLYYSRYELLPITDSFHYLNTELTGDINYDIDLIYGYLDTNHSKERISSNYLDNIKLIKSRNDIHVRKINGGYHIKNGRHRILYLKNFYVSNYQTYQEEGALDKLKELVKIPANIEYTIESPSINDILSKIKDLSSSVIFFKTNINNDNPELMIIYENKVYITKNEEELRNLYNYLSNSIIDNSYLIGLNQDKNNINYEELFEYLIITLKNNLYDMSLTDIINYLISEGFYQEEQYILTSNLNYYYLYFEYINFQHHLQIKRIHNEPINIIKETEEKVLKKNLGKIIMKIIEKNPDLLYLSWSELYSIISLVEELSNYSSEFLESAANSRGYQEKN